MGSPVLARDPHFIGFLNFWLGLEPGSSGLAHLSALCLSIDTRIGIDPVLSCCNYVGVADELDEEEAVERSKTTIGM